MGMCASLLRLGKKILWGCLLVLELVSQKLVWIVEKRIVGFISDRWTDQRSWEYIIFALGEAVCKIIFWCRFDFYLTSWPSPACGLLVLCLFAALSNSYFFSFAKQSLFFYFIFCTNQISTLFFICEIGRVSQAGGYWASTVQMHLPAKVQQMLSVRVKDKYPTGALSLFTWALHFFFFFFQDFYVICPDH